MQQTPRLRLIQVLLESIIPILGYFYWSWNAYFIAAFYVLEFAVNQVLFYIKLEKINDFTGNKHKTNYKLILFLVLSFLIIGIFALLFSFRLTSQHDMWKETIRFIFTKEMGIPQLFLLFPLLIIAGYMQFKNEFIKTKKFVTTNRSVLYKTHLYSIISVAGVLILLFFLSLNVVLNQTVCIFIWVITTAFYSYFFKNK